VEDPRGHQGLFHFGYQLFANGSPRAHCVNHDS
jgi:hypothetical protein